MKRITLITLLSVLSAFGAQADNINSEVLKQNNFRNALWMESNNTAGLAFKPFEMYKDLDIRYENQSGDFRAKQEASRIDNISLNTSGSAYLGKFLVWGRFSFRNIFEKGRHMNALMYEIEDDMPYYPVDTTKNSPWTKQEYELEAKLASPVLWNRVSFGIDVRYADKVGAKQLDPRAEAYKYYIDVKPSVAIKLGNSMIGINAIYQNGFERSKPKNENNWVNQAVFLHRGLGESIRGKVGDNDGIKEYMFKNNRYGGGIQYGYSGSADFLADFSFIMSDTHVLSEPEFPKKEGSTSKMAVDGNIRLLFGDYKSNSLWVKGTFSKTSGTEYIQQIATESITNQYWQVISQNVMSSFMNVDASFGYDHQFGADDKRGYDWIVGAYGDFMMKNHKYLLPVSYFKATTVFANVFGGHQFKFKSSSLLVKVNGGYGMSLGADYLYGGKNVTYEPVKMYQGNKEYYDTAYAKAGGSVSYTLNTKKIGYIFNVMADYIKPMGVDTDRLIAKASFGIVF